MKSEASKFARVIKCDVCFRNSYPKLLRDDSFNLPQPGYIGTNYKNTRVLLVGQNPGISHDYSNDSDEGFANALIAVKKDKNAQAVNKVRNILDRIMPTWDIFKTYFPLADCGLRLDDIAYTNVVRCRTEENAKPGVRISRICISKHFIPWLEPRFVLFMGKWAHDEISYELEDRGIPYAFINRDRSLSNSERRRNRTDAAERVRNILSSNNGKT